MTSFLSSNRYKIKRHLGKLLDLTAERNFLEMYDTLELLKGEIFKYCTLMDLKFKNFEKVLEDIESDLNHFTRADWRQEALRKDIKELHDLLTSHEISLSLYDRIKLISEDLDRNLSLLFTPEGTVKDDLLDSFDALQNLAPEIKELGFETFQLYRQTIRSANACKPFLPLKSADVDEKGRILIRPNELKNLQAHTSPLLSSLGDLISVFHQPPAPPKEKDKKGKEAEDKEEKKAPEGSIMADFDEMKRQELFLESSRLILREGWSWPDTARHLNLTSDDLLDIWDLEGVPEKDETDDEEDHEEQLKEDETEKPDDAETTPGKKPRPEPKQLEKFKEEKTKNNQPDDDEVDLDA